MKNDNGYFALLVFNKLFKRHFRFTAKLSRKYRFSIYPVFVFFLLFKISWLYKEKKRIWIKQRMLISTSSQTWNSLLDHSTTTRASQGQLARIKSIELKAGARDEGHQSSLRRSGSDTLSLIFFKVGFTLWIHKWAEMKTWGVFKQCQPHWECMHVKNENILNYC